ncbi:glyoxalase [Bacillus sp. FJAT-25509]|uniref:VOC family protein n=1 Tax=Bacillus sp. FJAT-25509 TaxID=1712029 RepID=UPI0006F2CE26|nr:VOC family protein [Bacillus sp. FJAT-25509]KQL38834.1 glyoxalase [Bacillus sp. FJAT-25509]
MLINKVVLQTGQLNKTKEFYINHLKFNCLSMKSNSFTIEVGESLLEFVETNEDTNPFYHFAFNISSNHFQEAKRWAQSFVKLTIEDGLDEIYFEFLDAHSFYFEDPSGNIVEFISRHSISPKSAKPFSIQSIININEINLTTLDVFPVGKQLISNGILVRNNKEMVNSLNFMGAKGCYILLGPPNRKWLFSNKQAEIFPVVITVDNEKIIKVSDRGEIKINRIK